MPLDLLIESGSDVTLIDVEIYNEIPESVRPLLKETETNLSTASGSPMTTSGQAHFKLQLGNSERSYPESNIDMKCVTIDDETHLLQIERTATCCRVRLTDSAEILPQHEMRLTQY